MRFFFSTYLICFDHRSTNQNNYELLFFGTTVQGLPTALSFNFLLKKKTSTNGRNQNKILGFSQSPLSQKNYHQITGKTFICKACFSLNDYSSIYVNIFSKSDIPVDIFLFTVKSWNTRKLWEIWICHWHRSGDFTVDLKRFHTLYILLAFPFVDFEQGKCQLSTEQETLLWSWYLDSAKKIVLEETKKLWTTNLAYFYDIWFKWFEYSFPILKKRDLTLILRKIVWRSNVFCTLSH